MKFIKVIYFDESSVADFMQIIAGGELKKTTEFISNVSINTHGEVDAAAELNTESKGLPKLFSFLSGITANASISAGAGANYQKDRIVKNMLENTLLADFIDLVESDKKKKEKNQRCTGIKIFHNLSVYPEQNSFSFLMLAAPFFTIMDGDVPIPSIDGHEFKLNISKIEEAIDRGRGYYEFISEIDNKEIILRFNISAFRNNYTMSDLPKMLLSCYAVYVGKTDKKKLNIEKEFEFGAKNLTRVDYGGLTSDDEKNEVDVYDVFLAGIIENDG